MTTRLVGYEPIIEDGRPANVQMGILKGETGAKKHPRLEREEDKGETTRRTEGSKTRDNVMRYSGFIFVTEEGSYEIDVDGRLHVDEHHTGRPPRIAALSFFEKGLHEEKIESLLEIVERYGEEYFAMNLETLCTGAPRIGSRIGVLYKEAEGLGIITAPITHFYSKYRGGED